ncbi:endonuclease [Pseudomonas laurylsulfativorans]|uniref:Endonuclease n=1 Tax=Pseudomonas laurylsulfativorans TaxID=1943631 RepID=A0A2S3VV82_9PSED|nr:DNA/RNA non-specific endonuclease [Pseudomonas laurylsulfativorans]POF43823.1 endonuclease [Pseudomonas laurylsulfativorans]
MYLRKIAVGLSALVLLSTGAQARSLLDLLKPPTAQHEQTSRSGSISQSAALNLYSNKQRQPSFDGCAELFPAAKPINTATVSASMKPLALCSDNFAVLYSQTSKTPLVVVERLNAAQLQDAKGEERTNQFYPDPRIPKGGRAELSDYRSQHPAVDRGHQSPAADAPNPNAMAQSFALSNMVPQDPTNNRKIWSKVEADVRKFAKRADGNVFVFTGPLFDPGYSTIGDNQVWVPTRLFKLVYDASSKRAWAYVLPNAETRIQKPMDYETFVKSTGLKLLGNLPVTGSAGRT